VLAGPPSQAELEGEALADLAQAHPLWMTDTDRTPMGADAAGRYLASPLGDRLAAYRRDELARRSVRHIERRLDWAEQTDHPLRPWTADTRDLTWEPTAAYASGPDAEYQQLPPTFDGPLATVWVLAVAQNPTTRSRTDSISAARLDGGAASRHGSPDSIARRRSCWPSCTSPARSAASASYAARRRTETGSYAGPRGASAVGRPRAARLAGGQRVGRGCLPRQCLAFQPGVRCDRLTERCPSRGKTALGDLARTYLRPNR
jgi:hypothetical protein